MSRKFVIFVDLHSRGPTIIQKSQSVCKILTMLSDSRDGEVSFPPVRLTQLSWTRTVKVEISSAQKRLCVGVKTEWENVTYSPTRGGTSFVALVA